MGKINRIPTVNDNIFFVEKIETEVELPSHIKATSIKGVLYQRKEIKIKGVFEHETKPDDYVNVIGIDENGIKRELAFPLVNDTVEKVFNTFYSTKEDVNKIIAELAREESKRCEDIATAILSHVQTLSDLIKLHS